jgi:hypothetical protein
LFDRRPSVISRDPQNQNSRDKILQRGISELGTRLRAYLPTITAIDRAKAATPSIARQLLSRHFVCANRANFRLVGLWVPR